jgi:hypothetical protein
MGHTSLSRSDPRFWDYNIRELALYDLPAIIEHVKKDSMFILSTMKAYETQKAKLTLHTTSAGYETVAFVGHSQGNATMFVSLGDF